MGGIVGVSEGSNIKQSVVNSLEITDTDGGSGFYDGSTGGLVGESIANSSIEMSKVYKSIVTGGIFVGGLVGKIGGASRVYKSSANAKIRANGIAGGLVGGMADGAYVEKSYANSSLIADAPYDFSSGNVGGLIGEIMDARPGNAGAVVNSYSTSWIEGISAGAIGVGGLVGTQSGTTAVVKSFFSGIVKNISGSKIHAASGDMQSGATLIDVMIRKQDENSYGDPGLTLSVAGAIVRTSSDLTQRGFIFQWL